MREGDMIVAKVVEEMNLIPWQEKCSSNGVYRSVAPTFVEKATLLVEESEVVDVGLGSQPVEIADFEIRPLVTG